MELAAFSGESELLHAAVDIYCRVFGAKRPEARDFVLRYSAHPGFIGVVALDDASPVGMAFGHAFFIGNWWCDRVRLQMGQQCPQLENAWVLVELGVLREAQGRGIGTAMHDWLLARVPQERVLLSTKVPNTGARRLYERLGWGYLHPGFRFAEGQELYTVMHQELRKPHAD